MKKLTQHLFFSQSEMQAVSTPLGVRYAFRDCKLQGRTGEPTFPVRQARSALPLDTRVSAFRFKLVLRLL